MAESDQHGKAQRETELDGHSPPGAEQSDQLAVKNRVHCLERGAGRRRGFVLAYFFSCSNGTGRVTTTVTFALSVGFIGYSRQRFGFTEGRDSPGE